MMLMWSRSLCLLSRNSNILLRSCLNVGQSFVGDIRDVRVSLEMDGIQMDFGFSFDAVPTIDTVLYFKGSMKEDGDGQR